jgi:ABC-type glycerol-3-phosphate transport system permease component
MEIMSILVYFISMLVCFYIAYRLFKDDENSFLIVWIMFLGFIPFINSIITIFMGSTAIIDYLKEKYHEN